MAFVFLGVTFLPVKNGEGQSTTILSLGFFSLGQRVRSKPPGVPGINYFKVA